MGSQPAIDAELLKLVGATNPAARAEIADRLCELAFESPPEDRVDFNPVVVQLLADQQVELRCAGLAMAAEVLAPVEAKEVLARHLTDAVTRVRVEAAGRLADLALPESRGSLAAALQDKALPVRFEAARGMVALQHNAGFDVLVEALDDADLRFRAASSLALLGNKNAIAPLKKAFSSWFAPQFDRTQIAGALAALGDEEGTAHLFKRATGRWSMDRGAALELLGEVKAPGAKELLLSVLNKKEDDARGTAARALGRLGDPSTETAMIGALDEKSSDDFRLDVAEGLLMLGTPGARSFVEGLRLSDPESAAELAAMIAEYE